MHAVPNNETPKLSQKLGRWKMLAIVLVCASPMIASYFTYYVIKPSSRTNYGELLDPRQYPIPKLAASKLDGSSFELTKLQGKWLMVQVAPSACAADCQEKLTHMRQLRLTQGKEKERVERVWLITDQEPLDTLLMRQYDGTHFIRINPQLAKQWLPVEQGSAMTDHVYMIDPLGNLMMRFPKQPDPNKMKKDIYRLLKASKIG